MDTGPLKMTSIGKRINFFFRKEEWVITKKGIYGKQKYLYNNSRYIVCNHMQTVFMVVKATNNSEVVFTV